MASLSDVTERGPLFPAELPTKFKRLPAGSLAKDLVCWWWISVWSLEPGQQSVQELLAFPASNLVFENKDARYWGPSTKRSTRVLEGRGWALGALLKPAAVPAFTHDPAIWRDASIPVTASEICATVQSSATDLEQVTGNVEAWLADIVGPLTDDALQANRLADLAINDSNIVNVSDLADALGVSERTVHRLTSRYVGLTPYSMIRRRRLQEAAEWIRRNPDESLADAAARFGFVDQAHLAREARSVLGWSLRDYRQRLEHR